MEARLDYTKASPEAYKAMLQMEGVVRRSGINPILLELIKIRASQLNGCAFCIDMHTKDARFKGESEQRIYRWMRGAKHLSSPTRNGQRWPGPRRSPTSRSDMRRTMCMASCARISARKKS